jgi:hypothetical protein
MNDTADVSIGSWIFTLISFGSVAGFHTSDRNFVGVSIEAAGSS